MLLLLTTFFAGMITVVAPCVLPLLPIIIGGSVSGDNTSKRRPYIIAASLAVSLIVFTLLLKATTVLVNIPPQAITYVSGVIIILIGLLTLFPDAYEWIIEKLGIQTRSQRLLSEGTKKQSDLGAIITGAALGPVFSSCSPVYAYILATVLPVSFAQAMVYIVSYVLGLSLVLLLIGVIGQRFVQKISFASNPRGLFQRVVAVMFIVVGLLVFTGYDKKVQTYVSANTPFNFDGLSASLIPGSKTESAEGVLNVKAYDAPEFSDDLSNWINSEPLTLKELRGKVVLVDFWTYSCINCIRTQPYLRGWNDTYKDSGLQIVGMHAPEFAFERVPANVEKAVKEAKLTYPIALDNNFSTWNAFGNKFWPGLYLIDKQGKVRRVHGGEGEYKETEQAIRELLAEDGGEVPDKMFVSGSTSSMVTPGQTPETYLGARRAVNYGGSPALLVDKVQLFSIPETLQSNRWAISGSWRVEGQTITAQQDGKLRFNFSAKTVYIVAGSNLTQSIGVTVNGKAMKSVEVKESKLYTVAELAKYSSGNTLELSVPPGVTLNVFTFGN